MTARKGPAAARPLRPPVHGLHWGLPTARDGMTVREWEINGMVLREMRGELWLRDESCDAGIELPPAPAELRLLAQALTEAADLIEGEADE